MIGTETIDEVANRLQISHGSGISQGPRAHTAANTMDTHKKVLGHLPNSPDFAPSDYRLLDPLDEAL